MGELILDIYFIKGLCIYFVLVLFDSTINYSQTCIGTIKKCPSKTGDLLEEVHFRLNFLRQDKKT